MFQRGNSTNQRRVLDNNVAANKESVFAEQRGQFSRVSRNKKQGRSSRGYANIVRKENINQQAGAELNVPTSNYWAPLNC